MFPSCPAAHRLLRETFEPEHLTPDSIFDGSEPTQTVVEVGPRTNFSTAWSTNATSICSSVGLDKVRLLYATLQSEGGGRFMALVLLLVVARKMAACCKLPDTDLARSWLLRDGRAGGPCLASLMP